MKEIIWKLNSRYAVVTCFDRNGIPWIEKTISSADPINGNPFWVNEVSRFFRQKLTSNFVPLVEPYYFCERGNNAIQTSPYVGPDAEKFFRDESVSLKNKFSALEKMIYAMSGVLLQGTNPEVGIDARLSNFCINGEGKVLYVDTFPALVKYKGEYIVHFPNPTSQDARKKEIARKFDRYGIIRRFRFSILEHGFGLSESDLLSAIENVLGKNFSIDIENYFSSLPREIPNELDTDTIREIAISQAVHKTGKEREEFLTQIFELSSTFGSVNLSTFERLSRINDLLNFKKTAVA